MSETPTDEELAEWLRNNVEMGEDYPAVRLIQEVRRLREESESRHKAQQEFQRVAEDYAESNRQNREHAEKAEASLAKTRLAVDSLYSKLLQAEAERDRYREELRHIGQQHPNIGHSLTARDPQDNNPNK